MSSLITPSRQRLLKSMKVGINRTRIKHFLSEQSIKPYRRYCISQCLFVRARGYLWNKYCRAVIYTFMQAHNVSAFWNKLRLDYILSFSSQCNQCTDNPGCFPRGESEQPEYGAIQCFRVFIPLDLLRQMDAGYYSTCAEMWVRAVHTKEEGN